MPFVAEARRHIPASPHDCYAKLADFGSWLRWMPSSFRAVDGPSRPLTTGDVIKVKIAGVPGVSSMRIVRAEPGRTIAWQGGLPGLLEAVHAFHFAERDGETLVHSEETWTGVLTRLALVVRLVKRRAEAVGTDQLDGLARALRN